MSTVTRFMPLLLFVLVGCSHAKPEVRAGSGRAGATPVAIGIAPEVELLEIERDLERWRVQLTEALMDAARLHAMVHSPGGSLVGAGDLSRPTLRRRHAEAQNKASVLEAKISAADDRRRELRADLRASD